MDPLYKVIKQLSEEEFEDFYQNLTDNKADKSALFLKTIRTSENPVEDFLEKQDISASAFYVLKSRLNQKIEGFLLHRLGDPNLEVIHKVFNIFDLLFESPREIAITTLKRMEKTMLEMDNPMGLVPVYRAFKMLYSDDEEQYNEYDRQYNQAVAYNLANDKAIDTVSSFFRAYDKYYLGRKEEDFEELVRLVEKVDNINNLYDSPRLYLLKSLVHLYGRRFLELPERVKEIMEEEEFVFDKCFQIIENSPKDLLFKHMNLMFDFLRLSYYYDGEGYDNQARIYFDLLDFKIEELLTGFNLGMDCSRILFYKLDKHLQEGTIDQLTEDNETYLINIRIETERQVNFLNYQFYLAYTAFYNQRYDESARILYRLRNDLNLRKHYHMDVELKLFLALSYVLMNEYDLANQLILSLQRQLKKDEFKDYEHARVFLKILSNRLGGSWTPRKTEQLKELISSYAEMNTGNRAILPYLQLEFSLFSASKAENY